METNIPVIAGSVSTVMFAASMVPMVTKALVTRDLHSYSLSSLALTHVANLVHSIYVFSLPLGPIWALHSFYVVVTGLMLALMLIYSVNRRARYSSTRSLSIGACRT
jgi:hypothetical protein